VTVNPDKPVEKWVVVAPGQSAESNQIVSEEFGEGQKSADDRMRGQLLAGQRRALTNLAVFAVNETSKPCEVIVYEGGTEPAPSTVEEPFS
jgi:hypothetical protein